MLCRLWSADCSVEAVAYASSRRKPLAVGSSLDGGCDACVFRVLMSSSVEKGPGEGGNGAASRVLAAGIWRDISSGSVLLREAMEEAEDDICEDGAPDRQG